MFAAAVQPFVERGEISGAVMLLATKDRVLTVAAVGQSDLASGRRMKTDDLFWIASMTKPVTAVGLAILADEGRLSFDDPVEKFLPEFRGQWVMEEQSAGRRVLVASPRPIKLRDLLTHTSGMGEYPVTEAHWTLAEMTKVVAREPLAGLPSRLHRRRPPLHQKRRHRLRLPAHRILLLHRSNVWTRTCCSCCSVPSCYHHLQR